MYTLNEIAKKIKVDPEKIRRNLNRKGHDTSGLLSTETVKEIGGIYAKNRAGRSIETIEAAKSLIAGEPSSDNKPYKHEKFLNKNSPKRQLRKKKKGIEMVFHSKGLLFFVFLCALGWQIIHSASLVLSVSLIENQIFRRISSILFAFSVQFTALLMTIHTGNINYLKAFAGVEFVINMLYYKPWLKEFDITLWFSTITISGAIAFTIYSYSELFTKDNNGINK